MLIVVAVININFARDSIAKKPEPKFRFLRTTKESNQIHPLCPLDVVITSKCILVFMQNLLKIVLLFVAFAVPLCRCNVGWGNPEVVEVLIWSGGSWSGLLSGDIWKAPNYLGHDVDKSMSNEQAID